MVNVELLERVMRHIDDNPEQHDQSVWMNECGTAGCFAGWVCALSGELDVQSYTYDLNYDFSACATRLLGLNEDDAFVLFGSENHVDDLKLMVKALANGESLADQFIELEETDRYVPRDDVS